MHFFLRFSSGKINRKIGTTETTNYSQERFSSMVPTANATANTHADAKWKLQNDYVNSFGVCSCRNEEMANRVGLLMPKDL